MDVDNLRIALRRQPFEPFTLHLEDGRVLHVPHPDLVAVSRRTVAVMDSTNGSAILLEPGLILSLEQPKGQRPSAPLTAGG